MEENEERNKQIEKITQEFLSMVKMPAEKAPKPFLLGMIGNIGSGKSTVARELRTLLPGAVHIQANSARYLLKQAGMEWGDNVRTILDGVIRHLIGHDYGVVVDGSTAEARDRQRLSSLADELHVPLMFVRIKCDADVCSMREQRKYDDPSWESSFEDFRVNTTEKMVTNVRERSMIHHNLDSKDITGLIGEIDSNMPSKNLSDQITGLADRIREKLS